MQYYTPKIEEVQIGFEYQLKCKDINNKIIWETRKIETVEDLAFFIINYIENKYTLDNIRVKYLDKADLLDLGWFEYPELKYYSNIDPVKLQGMHNRDIDWHLNNKLRYNEKEHFVHYKGYFNLRVNNKFELQMLMNKKV